MAKPFPLHMPENGGGAIPRHVAIIMDGNGRWAKERHLPRAAGHKKGAEALRNLLQESQDLGITHLTVYAFSSENWRRPEAEINGLMDLLRYYLKRELKILTDNNIRLNVLGDREKLPADIVDEIAKAENATAANARFQLNIALSYGAQQEIAQAALRLAQEVAAGRREVATIDENALAEKLYTYDQPELDLLIRTGGEYRLSNFLLWQSAYTELYFTPVLWPDFTAQHLQEAVKEFALRERRYGTTRD